MCYICLPDNRRWAKAGNKDGFIQAQRKKDRLIDNEMDKKDLSLLVSINQVLFIRL